MSIFMDTWFKEFKSWLFKNIYSKSGQIPRLDSPSLDELILLFNKYSEYVNQSEFSLFIDELCFAISYLSPEDQNLIRQEFLKCPLEKNLEKSQRVRLADIQTQLILASPSEAHLNSLRRGLSSQILLAVVENDTGDLVYLLKMALYLRERGYAAPNGDNLSFMIFIAEFVDRYPSEKGLSALSERRTYRKDRVDGILNALKSEFSGARLSVVFFLVNLPLICGDTTNYVLRDAVTQAGLGIGNNIADWRLATLLWIISSQKSLFQTNMYMEIDSDINGYKYNFSGLLRALVDKLPLLKNAIFLGELPTSSKPAFGQIYPARFNLESVRCEVNNFGFFSKSYTGSAESNNVGFMPLSAKDKPEKTIDPADIYERYKYLKHGVLRNLSDFRMREQQVLRFIASKYCAALEHNPKTYLVLLQVESEHVFKAIHRFLKNSSGPAEYLVINLGQINSQAYQEEEKARHAASEAELDEVNIEGLKIYFLRNGLSYKAQRLLWPVVNLVFGDGDNLLMHSFFAGIPCFPSKKFEQVQEGLVPALLERFPHHEFQSGLKLYLDIIAEIYHMPIHHLRKGLGLNPIAHREEAELIRGIPNLIRTFWLLAQKPEYDTFLQERFVQTVDAAFTEQTDELLPDFRF